MDWGLERAIWSCTFEDEQVTWGEAVEVGRKEQAWQTKSLFYRELLKQPLLPFSLRNEDN